MRREKEEKTTHVKLQCSVQSVQQVCVFSVRVFTQRFEENAKVLKQSLRFVISVAGVYTLFLYVCVCECVFECTFHIWFTFLGNENSSFTTQLPLTIHGIAHHFITYMGNENPTEKTK